MRKKALFFDVDGTLISEASHKIPPSAIEAIREARSHGHMAFINSGRVFGHLDVVKNQIQMDGYLCGCGTYIHIEGQAVYHESIPSQHYRHILEAVPRCHVDVVWEACEGLSLPDVSYSANGKKFVEKLRMQKEIPVFEWGDTTHDYDKFCLIAGPDSDKDGFLNLIQKDFEIIDRGDNFYECITAGHSKATAIEFVLKRYGIDLKDAYVFGDSMNDFPMFEYVPNAILMGDHDTQLEPYASFITKSVEENGVMHAMTELGII